MTLRFKLAFTLATLIGIAIPASAHHSFDSEYDSSRPLTITGEIIGFDWLNPHSSVHLIVRRDGKLQELRLEGGSVGFPWYRRLN